MTVTEEEFKALNKAADAAAKKGIGEYQEFFSKLTKEEKKAIFPGHERRKREAAGRTILDAG